MRVNALIKGKEDMEIHDRQQREEWLEKERATEERMRVLEGKLKQLEVKGMKWAKDRRGKSRMRKEWAI